MKSYFPVPYDETQWTCPSEQSSSHTPPDLMSMPVEDPILSQFPFNNLSGPPTLNTMQSAGPASGHVDLAKITEGETWNVAPRPIYPQRHADPASYSSAPSSSQVYTTHSTPTRDSTPRRRSSVKRADSDSSTESQAQPKRRMSSSGSPKHLPVALDADIVPKAELFDIECKAKPTAHSVIERRYRDSLNSRITQLDQTLVSTRQCTNKDGSPASNEDSTDTPGKTRKADVLNDAMRYVKQAELEKDARGKEIEFLRLRVAALEKLVMCGDCALLKQFTDSNMGNSTDF